MLLRCSLCSSRRTTKLTFYSDDDDVDNDDADDTTLFHWRIYFLLFVLLWNVGTSCVAVDVYCDLYK